MNKLLNFRNVKSKLSMYQCAVICPKTFQEWMYHISEICTEMHHFRRNLWDMVHSLLKCFGTNNCISPYLQMLFFFQISSGTEANCLFTSVLKCLNIGLPNYHPTDLRLQLTYHMAQYPEAYCFLSFFYFY